ncbi:MAG TPA: glycosyltransferase family 39 protein, partial [Phenylobacterium sp.]|nr:glycosyltransferase family 39 protein [Phenylobacterium sp.]
LLGAMLAAAACAWGASAFFGAPAGLMAGALLGATFLLSTEALIAKTDATLCGATTLAMAALGRIYAEARGGPPAGKRAWLLFWIGMSVGTLVKGPVAPMVAATAIAALTLSERRGAWLKRLNWAWGVILLVAICGPWAWAVTVATDGGFWSAALGGDLAPKLTGGQETHGAPPGYYALLSPIAMFPMTLLLPAAAVVAWTRRSEPGVRFALCWLIPTWLVFEALPTKLVHYTLPTYGAVAWLAAAALMAPIGKGSRWTGAVLAGLFGVLLSVGVFFLVRRYGDLSDLVAAIPAALLLAGAGLIGGLLLVRQPSPRAAMTAVALGVAGHATLTAGLAPRLTPLWLSSRVERVMAKAELLPEQGIADAPVTVAGYAEPSLVFALGTPTELAGPEDAAQAISEHRPAVVEQRKEAEFEKALAGYGARAHLVASVKGLDYSDGKKMTLRVYEAAPGSPMTGGQP